MFIRFVRPNRLLGTAAREGFFCAAYALRDSHLLDRHASHQLEAALAWFRANLKIPAEFNRSKSKARHDRKFTAGLSWFKADAKVVLSRAFDLAAFLDAQGYPTEIIRTARVGYIVYEDDWQVVAEPFSDTPT